MNELSQATLDLYREKMEQDDERALNRVAARAQIDPDRLKDALWYERMRLLELHDPTLESVR